MFGRRPSREYRPAGSRRGSAASSFREREAMSGRKARPAARRESPRRSFSFFASRDWNKIRIWTVGLAFCLLWATLWSRAYYLQVVKGPEYAEMARRQHTTREVVRGTRGNILDRNGNVIARSVECQSVWANPSVIADLPAAATALAPVLAVSEESLRTVLSGSKRFVWLKRKVDFNTAEKVRALGVKGVYLDVETERVYPYKHLAGQLLGFVNIDDQGIEGLEKAFESELTGREVTRLVERDASGRRFVAPDSGTLVDLRGRDVRLTIDTQVQFFAEEALAENVEKFGARWGGCIVVDVPSGDILAWAQYPFFDPNRITATPGPDRRNRLAMDALEQGSTIKSFLIAAALEEGVVTPETVIDCERGKWKLGRALLHDTHPYSRLTVDKILHVSSNIGAAKIGLKLGAERYRDYLSRLGFGERTGLPLAGEVKGILRPARKWAEIDLAASSFGQSFSATLAQMAQAYLCLAGGGVMRPLRLHMDDSSECRVSLADGDEAAAGAYPRIFSESTMREVRAMLREVVEEEGGTGKQARIPGLVVGGKTGTAQKADSTGKYGKGRVGSFVGILPTENPRYLICVLLDEPTAVQYGGVIAAPVFRHVALHTMAYHGHLPDTDDPIVKAVVQKEEKRQSRAAKIASAPEAFAPKTAGATAAEAAAPGAQSSGAKAGAKAGQNGAQASVKSDRSGQSDRSVTSGSAAELVLRGGAAASNQTPGAPGASGTSGTVRTPGASGTSGSARTSGVSGTDRVPAVVGMSMRGAVEVFASLGIVPLVEGRGGFVVRQSPAPGTVWPEGRPECTLWLEERAL